jgi:hypothetical protein
VPALKETLSKESSEEAKKALQSMWSGKAKDTTNYPQRSSRQRFLLERRLSRLKLPSAGPSETRTRRSWNYCNPRMTVTQMKR